MEAANAIIPWILVFILLAVIVLERKANRRAEQKLLDRLMAKDLRDLSVHALNREEVPLSEIERTELEGLRKFKEHVEDGVPIS